MFATTATPTPRLTSWERRCQYGFTNDAWSPDASQRALILCTVWTEIPAAGVLTLPNHLDQLDENQRLGEIDLWAPRYIDALYKVILNRARDAGDLHLLKRQTLIDAWPRLCLPTPLRDQGEARFDELAGRGRRLDPLRGPMHGLGRQYVLAERRGSLDGPTTGEVVLPLHLDWGPAPTYVLPDRTVTLYITVLREAAGIEDFHYLNWAKLVEVWPVLRIPDRVRDMWEVPFEELAGNLGLWGHGRRELQRGAQYSALEQR